MFWHRKKCNYQILIPPISKPFEKLSRDEAEAYYKWFLNIIPDKLSYLQQQCERAGFMLDFTPEAFVLLWKWFRSIAVIERTPENKLKDLQSQLMGKPESFVNHILNDSRYQLSLETEYIIRDIAIYFGEVFVRNHSGIYWGFHTDIKKDSFANMPLLLGFLDASFKPPFAMEIEPIHMVRVQASKLLDKTDLDKDLYNLYLKWLAFIP